MNQSCKTHIFMIFILLTLIGGSFVFASLPLPPNFDQLVFSIVVFLVPCIFYFIITGESAKEVLSLYPISLRHLLAAVLMGISVQPFMSLLSYLSSLAFPNMVPESMAEFQKSPFLLGLFTIAVSPAFFEEICFRGVIFSGFRNLSLPKACIMTGFFFAVMHLDPQQFLYTFVMGILFCYMVYQSKSILASMITHFIFNATQYTLFYFLSDTPELEETVSSAASYMPSFGEIFFALLYLGVQILFMLPFFFLAIYLFHTPNKKQPEKELPGAWYHPLPGQKESMFQLPVLLIIIFYFIFAVLPYIINFLMFFIPNLVNWYFYH